jgi:hypothetical protein
MVTGEPPAVSQENDRAVRNLAGLTRKTVRDGGKSTSSDPVQELVHNCETEDEFRTQVLELMRLGERTRRDIWYDPSLRTLPMEWLAKTFREVNKGQLRDVTLPRCIDLIVPSFGNEFGELDVTVIDTRGANEMVVREDLDLRLRDPRTAIVFCSRFNEAPGMGNKKLLQHMRQTFSEPLTAGKVSILVLPRPEEALSMKDDLGETAQNDDEGYMFKAMQVENDLRSADIPEIPVLFFNAQSDKPEALRTELLGQLNRMREAAAVRLSDLNAAVDDILTHHEENTMILAIEEVAKRLRNFLDAHPNLGAREWLAHNEALNAVRSVRHPSILWAATRRNGGYDDLNIIHQVGIGAARDARKRSARWFDSLEDNLASLKQDNGLAIAGRTIDQIGRSAATSQTAFLEAVQRAGIEVYHDPLSNSVDWVTCANEWGARRGFTASVADNLEAWFEAQGELKDRLESLVISLWENTVLAPLKRLADEAAPLPEGASAENIFPFRRRG